MTDHLLSARRDVNACGYSALLIVEYVWIILKRQIKLQFEYIYEITNKKRIMYEKQSETSEFKWRPTFFKIQVISVLIVYGNALKLLNLTYYFPLNRRIIWITKQQITIHICVLISQAQNNGARKTSNLHQNLIRLNNSYGEDRRNLAVLPHEKNNEYEKRSDNEINCYTSAVLIAGVAIMCQWYRVY